MVMQTNTKRRDKSDLIDYRQSCDSIYTWRTSICNMLVHLRGAARFECALRLL